MVAEGGVGVFHDAEGGSGDSSGIDFVWSGRGNGVCSGAEGGGGAAAAAAGTDAAPVGWDLRGGEGASGDGARRDEAR